MLTTSKVASSPVGGDWSRCRLLEQRCCKVNGAEPSLTCELESIFARRSAG
jgi:hypothetical protein